MTSDDPRHGTANGYHNLGCRCDRCRAAWAGWHRGYMERRRRRDGVPTWAEYRESVLAPCGTASAYRRGCRCNLCRTAETKARALRRRFGKVLTHNRSGYCNGCRCDVCREAQRVYTAERRAARRAAG